MGNEYRTIREIMDAERRARQARVRRWMIGALIVAVVVTGLFGWYVQGRANGLYDRDGVYGRRGYYGTPYQKNRALERLEDVERERNSLLRGGQLLDPCAGR